MPQSTYIIDADGNILRLVGGAVPVTFDAPNTPGYFYEQDTSFLTGDSPAVLDVETGLGRKGARGFVLNDGAGDFSVAVSEDGTTYGDEIVLQANEVLDLGGFAVSKIRLTWIADSAFRVLVK